MNKTNRITLTALAVIALLALPTGCGTLTTEQKAARVQRLCTSAAEFGTMVALEENPGWRIQFDMAYDRLNQLVTDKVVTGALLRDVLNSLPVKELKSKEARLIIAGATMIYDEFVGEALDIEKSVYVLAAATGLRDGMGRALGK